eukprot:365961-Chlamydomonas_euryale.AAC.18
MWWLADAPTTGRVHLGDLVCEKVGRLSREAVRRPAPQLLDRHCEQAMRLIRPLGRRPCFAWTD